MDTGPAATGRMRVCIGLTVAGAVLLMAGVIMVLVGEAMRVKSPHGWQGTVGLGETVAACGLGCGLALLIAVAAGRPGARRHAARSGSAARPRSERTSRAASGSASASGPAAHDSADDWLSPLRNSAAVHAPEPSRWSGQPIQEFSPALDYADDGWRTDSVTGFAGGSGPPDPPEQQEPARRGAHRATGGTGPEIASSSLPAAATAGAEGIADTASQTVITASRLLPFLRAPIVPRSGQRPAR